MPQRCYLLTPGGAISISFLAATDSPQQDKLYWQLWQAFPLLYGMRNKSEKRSTKVQNELNWIWITPWVESKIRCMPTNVGGKKTNIEIVWSKKSWGADRARWNSALSSKIALGAAHFALYLASTVWLLVRCSVAQSAVQSCTWQHLEHHFVLFRASHHRPSVDRKVKLLHPLTTSGPPSLWKTRHRMT